MAGAGVLAAGALVLSACGNPYQSEVVKGTEITVAYNAGFFHFNDDSGAGNNTANGNIKYMAASANIVTAFILRLKTFISIPENTVATRPCAVDNPDAVFRIAVTTFAGFTACLLYRPSPVGRRTRGNSCPPRSGRGDRSKAMPALVWCKCKFNAMSPGQDKCIHETKRTLLLTAVLPKALIQYPPIALPPLRQCP